MATFLARKMSAGSVAGQTRPEGGVGASLGPARPARASARAVYGRRTTITTPLTGSSRHA
jgi:hypothetical protein